MKIAFVGDIRCRVETVQFELLPQAGYQGNAADFHEVFGRYDFVGADARPVQKKDGSVE
jgi:hypothetical protein